MAGLLRWYVTFFEDDRLMKGLLLSTGLALVTAAVAGIVGSMAAFALTRMKSRYVELVRSLHTAPLITPGVVTGLAMLIFFSTLGLRGSFLALVAGHVVLSIPFVVLIVVSGLQSFDKSIEEAAVSLGASRLVAFLTVTIPAVKTSVISAAVFAFLNSFDEVVVTLFLPGPRTKTLPSRCLNTSSTISIRYRQPYQPCLLESRCWLFSSRPASGRSDD